ncbi:MAG: hypothetical protein AAB516_00885 [Patescibacteria group bacterium]
MTIIQPNKNNNKINLIISGSVVILVISAVWSIFLYNRIVNLRHENQNQEVFIRQIEVANAELKNRFYGMTDAEIFKSSVESQTLILEKNPKYLKLTLN